MKRLAAWKERLNESWRVPRVGTLARAELWRFSKSSCHTQASSLNRLTTSPVPIRFLFVKLIVYGFGFILAIHFWWVLYFLHHLFEHRFCIFPSILRWNLVLCLMLFWYLVRLNIQLAKHSSTIVFMMNSHVFTHQKSMTSAMTFDEFAHRFWFHFGASIIKFNVCFAFV